MDGLAVLVKILFKNLRRHILIVTGVVQLWHLLPHL